MHASLRLGLLPEVYLLRDGCRCHMQSMRARQIGPVVIDEVSVAQLVASSMTTFVIAGWTCACPFSQLRMLLHVVRKPSCTKWDRDRRCRALRKMHLRPCTCQRVLAAACRRPLLLGSRHKEVAPGTSSREVAASRLQAGRRNLRSCGRFLVAGSTSSR